MPEDKKSRKSMEDVEELKEVLSVVSDKVPALIKGLVQSVFSPESAADMGKAAATYYKELKAGGIPDDVAVKMTQDYVGMFTRISEFIKTASRGEHGRHRLDHLSEEVQKEVSDELEKHLGKRLKVKLGEDEKEDTSD